MQTRGGATVVDGRYELEQELGRGSTGMVWRARDVLLGRTVALRIVHPTLADDPRFTMALADQVRALASLDAPALVRLFDTGEEGVPYLVHRFVEGESLRAIAGRDDERQLDAAVGRTVDVLLAIAPAHDAGLLHLHLTLDDVFVDHDGTTVVTDLAIGPAVVASRSPEDAVALLGPDVAPEIVDGGEVDVRSDVWGVGALLFELLTGERPAGRRSVREVRGDVPRPVDRAIARALAVDPSERFPDARSFADALASSRADHDGVPPRRGAVRSWIVVPLLVAVAAVAAIGVGLWMGRLEVGGPLGIRAVEPPAQTSTEPPARAEPVAVSIRPVSAAALDPLGDGTENPSSVPAAIDGDETTAWRTEAYRYPNGELGKDGVGIVFDLGASRTITGFRLTTPHPGYGFAVAAGDDPATLLDALGEPRTAEALTRGVLTGAGRYVLVWVTSVVDAGDGNRAEIAEFRAIVASDA